MMRGDGVVPFMRAASPGIMIVVALTVRVIIAGEAVSGTAPVVALKKNDNAGSHRHCSHLKLTQMPIIFLQQRKHFKGIKKNDKKALPMFV